MKNKPYILEERKEVIFQLKSKGYDNATVARILFDTNRSNITRFLQGHHADFKKYLLQQKSS